MKRVSYMDLAKAVDKYIDRVKNEHSDNGMGYAAVAGGLSVFLTDAMMKLSYERPDLANEMMDRLKGK